MRGKKLFGVIAFLVVVLVATAWFAVAANGSDDSSMPDIEEATELLKSELITKPGFVGIGHSKDVINVYLVNNESGRDLPDEYKGYPVQKIITGEISIED